MKIPYKILINTFLILFWLPRNKQKIKLKPKGFIVILIFNTEHIVKHGISHQKVSWKFHLFMISLN